MIRLMASSHLIRVLSEAPCDQDNGVTMSHWASEWEPIVIRIITLPCLTGERCETRSKWLPLLTDRRRFIDNNNTFTSD